MGTFIAQQSRGYNMGLQAKVASNSLSVTNGDLLTLSSGFISKAGASSAIEGVSCTQATYSATNQTVEKLPVVYRKPTKTEFFKVKVSGSINITFSGSFSSGQTITMNVNGVAMTGVGFNTNDAQTLTDLANQLQTQFGSVIESAAHDGALGVNITVRAGKSVAFSNIVVSGGGPTATVTDRLATVGTYFNIVSATNQVVDGSTVNTSPTNRQLKLEKKDSQTFGIFSII